ncbi:MAG: hypothetical protein C0424_09110 [Sphingobacteriaceae bacterium]|nr:hypothetical protein [Sphingobacteriaceae bacterium]
MQHFLLLNVLLLAMACQPSETPEPNNPNNPNNPGGGTTLTDNSMRITPPGAGVFVVNFTNPTSGDMENDSRGRPYFAVKNIFLVQDGNRNFDRIAVGFRTQPAAGSYPIANVNYYGEIPEGSAAMNVTYQGWNHRALSGTVVVSLVNGNIKVEANDVIMGGGARVTGDTTALPDSSRCDLRLLTF